MGLLNNDGGEATQRIALITAASTYTPANRSLRGMRVLEVDGPLFYRNMSLGDTTFQSYLVDALFRRLCATLTLALDARVLVFCIDVYGPDATAFYPLPKDVVHADRYAKAREIIEPERAITPAGSVERVQLRVKQLGEDGQETLVELFDKIDFTDIFGFLPSRCAFNEMVTDALLTRFAHDALCTLLAQDAQRCTGEFLFIVHGGRLDGAAMQCPRAVLLRDATVQDTFDYQPPPSASPVCNQVESDIILGYYALSVFRNESVILHSSDIDIQLVTLFNVEVLARNTRTLAEVPERVICKCYATASTGAVTQLMDMREQYQCVRNVFTQYGSRDTPVDPVVLYAMLVISAGNDFMDQTAGVRMRFVFAAYFRHYTEIGPLVIAGPPTAHDARWPEAWPVRIVYAGWRRLILFAAKLMDESRVRKSYDSALLHSDNYMRAQCARLAWAINYYRNAQHTGYVQPMSTERDEDDRSFYGYKLNARTGKAEYCNNVRPQRVYCGALYSEERMCEHYAPVFAQQHA